MSERPAKFGPEIAVAPGFQKPAPDEWVVWRAADGARNVCKSGALYWCLDPYDDECIVAIQLRPDHPFYLPEPLSFEGMDADPLWGTF